MCDTGSSAALVAWSGRGFLCWCRVWGPPGRHWFDWSAGLRGFSCAGWWFASVAWFGRCVRSFRWFASVRRRSSSSSFVRSSSSSLVVVVVVVDLLIVVVVCLLLLLVWFVWFVCLVWGLYVLFVLYFSKLLSVGVCALRNTHIEISLGGTCVWREKRETAYCQPQISCELVITQMVTDTD